MIYAIQVPDEYQDSHFDFSSFMDIAFYGNRGLKESIPDWIKNVKSLYNNVDETDFQLGYTDREIIEDYIRNKLDDESIQAIKEVLLDDSLRETEAVCKILDIITGTAGNYRIRTLRGCCQSEWIDIMYPSQEYSSQSLDIIETSFFNMGTEWEVRECDDDAEIFTIEDARDASIDFPYFTYCSLYGDEEIRAFIAEGAGVTAEEVKLFKFDSWVRTACYSDAC